MRPELGVYGRIKMEGFKEKYFGKEIVLSKDQCYVLSTTSHFRQKAADAAQQYLQKYKSYKNQGKHSVLKTDHILPEVHGKQNSTCLHHSLPPKLCF